MYTCHSTSLGTLFWIRVNTSSPRALSLCAYINFIVFGLIWQGRNYGLLSSEASGPQQVKFWLYLKLQGYFGYENDRTHVIKLVVLVVKITIQLTYGIHGCKKKEHTTTRLFNGDARTKRICRKQIFRSSHAFHLKINAVIEETL